MSLAYYSKAHVSFTESMGNGRALRGPRGPESASSGGACAARAGRCQALPETRSPVRSTAGRQLRRCPPRALPRRQVRQRVVFAEARCSLCARRTAGTEEQGSGMPRVIPHPLAVWERRSPRGPRSPYQAPRGSAAAPQRGHGRHLTPGRAAPHTPPAQPTGGGRAATANQQRPGPTHAHGGTARATPLRGPEPSRGWRCGACGFPETQ